MNKPTRLVGLILLFTVLGACSGPDEPGTGAQDGGRVTVSGSVAYRERIALPAGSVVNIALNDISRADVAATEIASQSVVTSGEQVPIDFELTVDREALRPGMTYAVRAEIRDADGELHWVTDTVHRVDSSQPGPTIDMGSLPLVRVSRSASTGDGTNSLAGTRWTVVSIVGQSVGADSRAALVFGADNNLSGNASCNSFTGNYSLSGPELTTGQMAVTMMACPGPLTDLERNFLAVMTGTSRISFNAEGLLVITSADGNSILARRAPDERSLAGSNWSVVSIAGRDLPEGTSATLIFGENGELSGNASCNRYSGRYSLDGDDLAAGQLAVTRMACPEPQASFERDFLQILAEPARVTYDAPGVLVITSPDGPSISARRVTAAQ